jgi:hypothetical protein
MSKNKRITPDRLAAAYADLQASAISIFDIRLSERYIWQAALNAMAAG